MFIFFFFAADTILSRFCKDPTRTFRVKKGAFVSESSIWCLNYSAVKAASAPFYPGYGVSFGVGVGSGKSIKSAYTQPTRRA